MSAKNGGAACPADEHRPCTPCQFTWQAWSLCDTTYGTQTRTPLIQSPPLAYNGQVVGTSCPKPEEQPCPVDCKGAYGPWSDCTSLNGGNYPPFTRQVTYTTFFFIFLLLE